MKKSEKIKQYNELIELIQNVNTFVFTNYKGLNVQQISLLRKKLKEVNFNFKIVKNRILKRVFETLKIKPDERIYKEPLGIIFSKDAGDEIKLSKVLDKFIKENEIFKIKSAIIEGKIVSSTEFMLLRTLPEKPILQAQLIASLKSPINNFYSVFKGLLLRFIYILKAIENVKRQR